MVVTWNEALAESEARGEARGSINSTRGAILLYLEHRFGKVPADLGRRLEAISEQPRLLELLEAAFETASLRDFQAAVEGVPPSAPLF